ncbi:MAG: SH3 domain-containing protein [Treponema sp.]|nr:SH3 domain-containing protein [Treponema sp.]
MKKAFVFICISCLAIFNVYTQTDLLMSRYSELRKAHGNIQYDEKLTNTNLESVNWYYPPYKVCDGNISLTFYKNEFILQAMHLDEVLYGTYTIKDNKIICNVIKVFPNTQDLLKNISMNGKSFELEYRIDKTDFWYSIKLIHENQKTVFYALGTEAEFNKWYIINTYDVYKYDGDVVVSNGKLNVREMPNISSEKVYVLDDKMHIKIIGKTKNEDTIDGIKSCWYYVDYAYEDMYCPVYGWVFGGYIKTIK